MSERIRITVRQENSIIVRVKPSPRIPKVLLGKVGPQGPVGPAGPQGDPGAPGEAATINVGTTTTLDPGEAATVENSGTDSAAILDFGIPKGEQGDPGPSGLGIVAYGSYSSPAQELGNGAKITVHEEAVQRLYLSGDQEETISNDISIEDGSDNQMVILQGTSSSKRFVLDDGERVRLSGAWVAGEGSILTLIWTPELEKFMEYSRNEIF